MPAHGWVGRYRCDRCGAFGYRRGVNDYAYDRNLPDGQRTREYIVEYRCAVPGCDRPGVVKERGKWSCADHRRT